MKALLKTETKIEWTEVGRPSPGPGEVVVKVMCAGLGRTDLYVGRGLLAVEGPRVLGHEGAGVICQLGQGVSQDRLGDRVALFPWIGCGRCEYCMKDPEKLHYFCPDRQFLGWHRDGCFADFIALPESRCVVLEEDVSFQVGAFLEPLTAALGVLRSPIKQAKEIAVLGKNYTANLTSTILTNIAKIAHQQLAVGESAANSWDLVVETEATEQSLGEALRILKPDGVLVLKSRPAESVKWPVRLQVEKEITTFAVSYGTIKMAQMLLKNRACLFTPFFSPPKPLTEWSTVFQERAGGELVKAFFTP